MYSQNSAFLLDLDDGRVYPLQENLTTIGSSQRSDIVLAQDGKLARMHAVVRNIDAGFVIEDFESGAGTWVNGFATRGYTPLHCGDEIEIGGHRLILISQKLSQEAYEKVLNRLILMPNVFSLVPCPGDSILSRLVAHLAMLGAGFRSHNARRIPAPSRTNPASRYDPLQFFKKRRYEDLPAH